MATGVLPQTTDSGSDSGSDSLVDPRARSANLDILRAVAALMVVFHHAYLLQGEGTPFPARGPLFSTRWFIDALVDFGSSGVWLFFALSGYLISRPFVRSLVQGDGLPTFVPYAVRRAARIYPLYWVALTATILLLGITTGIGIRFLPFHYGLVHNVVPERQAAVLGVAWSLTVELLFYLVVPLAAFVIARAKRGPVRASSLATMVALLWLASIVWAALAAPLDYSGTQAWLRAVFPAMFGMFCPGILLAIGEQSLEGSRWRRWLQEFPFRPRIAIPVAIVCLATAGALAPGLLPARSGADSMYVLLHDLTRPLFAIGFGLVLALAIRSRPWGGRLRGMLVGLGIISYGIYLIHAVLLRLLEDEARSLVPLRHGGAFAYVVHAALLLALTLPLAWLSWRFFERPILQRAVRFGKDWEAAHT